MSLRLRCWLRTARRAGAHPSIAGASVLSLLSAPLAIAAAISVLILTGMHQRPW